MRIVLHDFAGHPFQIQLSRALADGGHHVTHAYPIGLQGPKGRLNSSETDSDRFSIRGIPLRAGFRKYSAYRRFTGQRIYARDLKSIIQAERADVVLSGNTPIDVQAELLLYCRRHGIGFVHWVQDVYCQALQFFLRRKLGRMAAPLALPFRLLERWVARNSSATVVIAPSFRDLFVEWGIPRDHISVVENWAPLEEVPPLPRANAWSDRHGLTGKTVFLYSGTLGLKHRPDLLYRLAESLDKSCMVVVISEGIGREYLDRMPKLDNLLTLDFQPYEELPQVLAAADVLVATLEADAGQFAVPSKILTYLCAGRPVLLAAPKVNLAASVVECSKAGFVIDGDNVEAWTTAAARLSSDSSLRETLATNARSYAQRTFDIAHIAGRFEEILLRARSVGSDLVPGSVPLPETEPEA